MMKGTGMGYPIDIMKDTLIPLGFPLYRLFESGVM